MIPEISNIPKETRLILEKIVDTFRNILKDNLIGIYLHGSIAMGCFNPEKSDIDFLLVVKEKLSEETKRAIINSTLELANLDGVPQKGLEFSIVLGKYLRNFVHPMPFELHYSKDWHKAYEENKIDLDKENRDKDLTAHITVIVNRGICLYGEPIKKVFPSHIPVEYYTDSLLYDLEWFKEDIDKDPVYGILNLCRIVYFLERGVIASKEEGGLWGIENLPKDFKDLILKALEDYTGKLDNPNWDRTKLLRFTKYMVKRINSILILTPRIFPPMNESKLF